MSVYDDIYHYGMMGMQWGKKAPNQKKKTKNDSTSHSREKDFVTDRLAQGNNIRVNSIPNGITKIKRSRNFVADRILDGKRLIIKKRNPLVEDLGK